MSNACPLTFTRMIHENPRWDALGSKVGIPQEPKEQTPDGGSTEPADTQRKSPSSSTGLCSQHLQGLPNLQECKLQARFIRILTKGSTQSRHTSVASGLTWPFGSSKRPLLLVFTQGQHSLSVSSFAGTSSKEADPHKTSLAPRYTTA